MNFSNLHRSKFIEQLSSQTFDLLIIGGGITGCGIALDAALRGMKVALIEKNDFASGTSSRSTKLIHGGLRYLKQLEFKLVYEVGREREIVHHNARHLVIPQKMLLPITENGTLGKSSLSLGLMLYDFLAGVRKEERRIMLDKHETLKAEPLLNNEKLIGSGLYYEYRTDDSRLVIEVAKSAFAIGAVLVNYLESKSFLYDDKQKIIGVKAEDKTSGKEFEIRVKTVVNSCGHWVDMLRKEDNSLKGKRLQLTKGVHLVFSHDKLPIKQAVYFEAADGRMVFAIPRNNITYVGTTDTVYNQDLDKPQCNREDAEYLLDVVNKTFPSANLKKADIESSWAGLRSLIFEEGKSASELSRKDEIMISPSGLISIAGGKLTGYRLMAEKIADLVEKKMGKTFGSCKTKIFRLSGGEFESDEDFKRALEQFLKEGKLENIPAAKINEWFYRYGRNVSKLMEYVKSLHGKIDDNAKLFESAELFYCIQHEMIYHLEDFLVRRTGKIFFHRRSSEKHIDYLAHFLSLQLPSNESGMLQEISMVKQEFKSATSFT